MSKLSKENSAENILSDPTKLFKHYSAKAAGGDPKAQFSLACLLIKGVGVEKNMELGLLLLSHSANQGYQEAKDYLVKQGGKVKQASQRLDDVQNWFEENA